MAAEVWVKQNNRRSECFSDYQVEIKMIPAIHWRMGKRLRSGISVRPDEAILSVEFRGKGQSRSSVLFKSPHKMAAGFMLPKADAARLAHALIMACDSEENGISVIPVDGIERRRLLGGSKIVLNPVQEKHRR